METVKNIPSLEEWNKQNLLSQNILEIISNKNVFSTAHIGGYSESALIDVASKSLSIVKTEL